MISPATAALLAMPDDLPFAMEAQFAQHEAAAEQRAFLSDPDLRAGQPLPAILAVNFMTAGNATFTMVSKKTGKRFTFRLRRPKDQAAGSSRRPIFVSVLNGSDNTNDYAFLGTIWEDGEKFTYRPSPKSPVSSVAPSQAAAQWLAKSLNYPDNLAQADIYHAGKCGRCNRQLTVPSSIQSGIGPECATKL